MEEVLKKFQHLRIKLETIKSSTNNFDDQNNRIGVGGFGNVYKGKFSHSKTKRMVAVKRLDPKHGQGIPEFLKEIMMLSRYRHQNLVSLLGFCYERDELILVYAYASHGSLERHLNSPHLTWKQRLKICLDVANALSYLHDPKGTHQRLIHCDIKSSNILLDDHWNAKVSDFGLSIMGPANEQHSVIVTFAAGTPGYCDPQYAVTHTLTKESDVYSFGVVLFEVLFGTLCYTHSNGRFQKNLVPTWKKCYEQKKLNDIIFKDPSIQPLEQSVLELFSNIAYQCLNESRENRPEMTDIVAELSCALNIHELLQSQQFRAKWSTQSFYYKEMAKTVQPPLNYRSEDELKSLLSKGVLLNGGKTYFSLNNKGEHCEMIPIAECVVDSDRDRVVADYNYNGFWSGKLKTRVKTQFLSPGITYTVNLVFDRISLKKVRICEPMSLKYELQGENSKESSISYLAYEREDGWWMTELYQFTCDYKVVRLQILFQGQNSPIKLKGIEFRPLEKVDGNQHTSDLDSDSDSDLDANWKEKLPTDFEDIMKRLEKRVQFTTKKEAYSYMREGFFYTNNYNKRIIWFSLDKNGKKCHMRSAREALDRIYHMDMLHLPESRFGEAFLPNFWSFTLKSKVRSLVSSETTYAIYLVYKLSKDQSGFEAPMRVVNKEYFKHYFFKYEL